MSKKHKVDPETLPYRPNVGVALFNAEGKVWVGQRIDTPGDSEGSGTWWQMPQGGVDEGEELLEAARRELYEETSIRSVSLIAEAPDWLLYDLPPDRIGKTWGGKYRGQKQKWFAFRFEGEEGEIDIHHPGGGRHKPEFMDWRWQELATLPDTIVPFKRAVYLQVAKAFAKVGKAK
jgi:putative (di)nucleoside polyphosphate hydrolase